MINVTIIKDAVKVLQAFEKAARQLTTISLLAGRESIILIIAENNNKDYND